MSKGSFVNSMFASFDFTCVLEIRRRIFVEARGKVEEVAKRGLLVNCGGGQDIGVLLIMPINSAPVVESSPLWVRLRLTIGAALELIGLLDNAARKKLQGGS